MLNKMIIGMSVLAIFIGILLVGTFYFKSKDSNLLLQDSSLNSNNQYNVLEGSGDKLKITKELKNITVLSSNDTIEAYELDKKVRTLSQGTFIGHGSRDFECTTIIQDEILIECEQINDTAIRMIQSFVNESSLSKDYQWKIGIETDGEKYIVSENRTKENITKEVIINIPYGTSKITYSAGISSTTVDATAPNDATREVGHDKMCRLIDGTRVITYEGTGSEIYLGLSGTEGENFNTEAITTGTTSSKPTVFCSYNNSVGVSWIQGIDMYTVTLGTGATSIGTPYEFFNPATSLTYQKCLFDNETNRKCIAGLIGTAYYINDTNGGVELTGTFGGSIVVADIDIDSNQQAWILAADQNDDVLYLYNEFDGFSSPIVAYNLSPSSIGSYPSGAFSFRIYREDGIDKMVASISQGAVIKIINSTVIDNTTWSNITAESTGNSQSTFGLTPEGRYEVLSTDGSTTSSVRQLFRANSTPSKDSFDSGEILKSGGANYPDMLDGGNSMPWTSRPLAYKGINEYIYSDDGGSIFFANYTIPLEGLPFNLTIFTPNTTDPYDANSDGLNTTINFSLIDLDGYNWIYNLTYNITVGGEQANISTSNISYVTIAIRSNDSIVTDANGDAIANFTEFSNTSYSIMAIAFNYSTDQIYELSWNDKNPENITLHGEDSSGNNEQSVEFMFAAISYGVFDLGNNNQIECGNDSNTINSPRGTVNFTNPFASEPSVFAFQDNVAGTGMCYIDSGQIGLTGFGWECNTDTGTGSSPDNVDWCGFSQGEYDIENISIKAGKATQASEVLSVTYTTPYENEEYVIAITGTATLGSDGCFCQVFNRTTNNFDAVCQDDGDSEIGCNGVEFYWVTIGKTYANETSFIEEEQIWYDGQNTLINISMPNFTSGLKDLYINITYDTANISILESEVVSYGVAANSCTYTSGNWNFDFCDICNITEDVDLGGNILNGTQSEACSDGAFNILGANLTNVGNQEYQCSGANKCNVNVLGGSIG